jgi:release factor glutamine methyltransferase
LRATVVTSRAEPFGPVMAARAATLRAQGTLGPTDDHEELVVICASRIRPRRTGTRPTAHSRVA